MSAPDIDMDLMGHFAPLADGAHLTIILGAGASMPSGLPTWDEFAQKIAVLTGLVKDPKAAELLLAKQDPTFLLEAAKSSAEEHWEKHLNTALFGDPPLKAQPSSLHLAVASHYLAQPTSTTLATLNYDTLLEEAVYNELVRDHIVSTNDSGKASDPTVIIDYNGYTNNEVIVHHLHGVLFEGAAFSPIVSFKDYADLLSAESPWQRGFLSQALHRGPLLLAGTSYRDPDIRHWLHLVIRDEKPPYPALVSITRQGLGLSQDKFGLVKEALLKEWEAIGLVALPLEDLSDTAVMLRELGHLHDENYLAPQKRVAEVWERHCLQLDNLQMCYSTRLAHDSRRVSEVLGSKTQRATLWLADGAGLLARWASQSACYRSINQLKRIPTGHDSPWVAGEAIGKEETIVCDTTRDVRVSPHWSSILAIPIFANDGTNPRFATGVLTFGLETPAERLDTISDKLGELVRSLSDDWGEQLSRAAFHQNSTVN